MTEFKIATTLWNATESKYWEFSASWTDEQTGENCAVNSFADVAEWITNTCSNKQSGTIQLTIQNPILRMTFESEALTIDQYNQLIQWANTMWNTNFTS